MEMTPQFLASLGRVSAVRDLRATAGAMRIQYSVDVVDRRCVEVAEGELPIESLEDLPRAF